MRTFLVMRRGAWEDEPALEDAAAESIRVADEDMPDRSNGSGPTSLKKKTGHWALSAFTRPRTKT